LRKLACVISVILCVGCGGGGGGNPGTTVGVPVFSPSPGTYATAQSVTLSTTTSGATIRYTTDGSTPSETVGTVYAGPIAVASSVTIRAAAYLSGWTTSPVSSGAYTISIPGTVSAPTFSPSPGTYATAQSVTLSTTTSGATIRYTTDGSTPSETVGTMYAGPIAVASSVTIRAAAYLSGWTTSSVSSGAYTINIPAGTVSAPTFSPSPGAYTRVQNVTLSTSTPGASIRYTTDGSTPSETVGTVYAGPIAVASSVTIRAVGYLSGWRTSSVSSGAYTITVLKINVTVGSREVVFDWTTDRCEDFDLPDGPARFVRASDGELVMFSGNAPRYHVSRGSDFNSLKRVCEPALISADKRTPESYENWEWLWAVYREGDKWHAFVHNEFHDAISATCSVGDPSPSNPCWYNSVTYAVSSDDGRTFTKPNAPAHVVAPAPNAWVPPPVYPSEAYVAEGYFAPSSIVRGPDGYYYSLMNSIPDKSNMSARGICAIRSDRLDDPTSWRAWDGSGFNLRLTNPYATGASATVCTYLHPVIGNSSLSYNTYLGLYMLVNDSHIGGVSCGIYFMLSYDMVHWGPRQMIAPARLPWCDADPATPGILEPVVVMYPSLLDHSDTGVNFDRTGQTVYLYYTRFNDGGLDRDLVRVPVTFTVE
jgi:Chitobiase/beta-hexosaminidase C-terminal domain